jgi:glucose/arabinose dehydrogenase
MKLAPAARRAVSSLERLEPRRLLAVSADSSPVTLPFALDFSTENGGFVDQDGQGTGLTVAQPEDPNVDAGEFDASLIDLDTAAGTLTITSAGNATNGSNFRDDNSLVNGLQVPFDASSDWVAHTRLLAGPDGLDSIDVAFEQAGLLVGPTQDAYAKLVLQSDGNSTRVQFVSERPFTTGVLNSPGSDGVFSDPDAFAGADLATANFIDFWIAGDVSEETLSAQYQVAGGPVVRLTEATNVSPDLFTAAGGHAGVLVAHKNDVAPLTASFDFLEVEQGPLPGTVPTVREVRPADGATGITRDSFVAVDLQLPNGSVSGSTLDSSNVKLIRVADDEQVPAELNTTGGGDSIVLSPLRALDADTEYRFEITDGVTDIFGTPFEEFTSTFRTNFVLNDAGSDLSSVAFEQVALPEANGTIWSSVNLGPDDRLYATSISGLIRRWDLNADGTLGTATDITSLTDAEGAQRVVTGLTFAPTATAANLVAYVSHTQFNDVTTDSPAELGDDFTGKLTRLSGPALGDVQDIVVGLPRSIRDHINNQPVFGPDGRIYFGQGANTAMGAPDAAWGDRPERELSGAVLAVDLALANVDVNGPVDVGTGPAGSYDPDATGAPVTIFAEGVRNAYDLVFHSNGSVYAPTNGSAAGGNAPTNAAGDPGQFRVDETQNDYLFRLEQGGYYGHPNPERGNLILNGGNPTSAGDLAEVASYDVGVAPDDDYRGFAFDFGKNISPNGAIEYTSDAFGGALQNKLIVTRWSGGDDLIVLDVADNGVVVGSTIGLPGLTGFAEPLDLAQTAGGAMYLAEYGTQTIKLLRPVEPGGKAAVADRRVYVDAAAGSSATRDLVIRNDGDEPLVLSPYTLGLLGPDQLRFDVKGVSSDAVTVAPGDVARFPVNFNPPANADVGDTFEVTAFLRTSDPAAPEVGARFVGFVKRGNEGANEPSLQDIFDLYDLGIATGDSDPTTVEFAASEILSADGIDAQRFRAANPEKPVAFEIIGSFNPPAQVPGSSVLSFGQYEPGRPSSRTLLAEVFDSQALTPDTQSAAKFTPAGDDGTFGLYVQAHFNGLRDPIGNGITDARGRLVFSEDELNTWDVVGERDKVAVFPIPGVRDAYAFSFEESGASDDYNDIVVVMTNVAPVDEAGGRLAVQDPDELFSGFGTAVFSDIPVAFRDNTQGTQQVRNTRSIDLVNVGDAPITITGVSVPPAFDASGANGLTFAPGGVATVPIAFTPGSDGAFGGDVVLSYAGGSFAIPVSGFRQPYSEDDFNRSGITKPSLEPTLDEILELFDITTDVGTVLTRDSAGADAVGDEVLSPFWKAARPGLPVEVYQLAAYHSTAATDFLAYFPQSASGSESAANGASITVLTHDNVWAQSVLPGVDGGTVPAAGTFDPQATTFGIRVSGEYSIDAFNDASGGQQDVHSLRFFPLLDGEGDRVADAWLLVMDFDAFNFDYNDNVFVLHNLAPALDDEPGEAVVATSSPASSIGVANVYYALPDDAAFARLFRRDGPTGDFTFVEQAGARGFFTLENVTGETYVQIVTRDSQGEESAPFELRIN